MSDTVLATIKYVAPNAALQSGDKAYILHYTAPPGIPQSNYEIESYPGLKVRSLRTSGLSYEEHGLKIATLDRCVLAPAEFDDDDKVEKVYLPELHGCLVKALGARDVVIFDWLVRRRAQSFPVSREGEGKAAQPSLSAHIDYTTEELKSRIPRYFGDKPEVLANRRYQVINVWKPLEGPLRDYPMAYCDPKSVAPTDLLVVDEVFPKVANEIFQTFYNPNHKWYWVPDQLPSEVTIFQSYDSERGQALAVPHCSFDLGAVGSGVPRQSIEVRAFVLY